MINEFPIEFCVDIGVTGCHEHQTTPEPSKSQKTDPDEFKSPVQGRTRSATAAKKKSVSSKPKGPKPPKKKKAEDQDKDGFSD